MHWAVQTMYEKCCIFGVTADKCKNHVTDLCSKAASSLVAKCSAFSLSRDRLDSFYFDIIDQNLAFEFLAM